MGRACGTKRSEKCIQSRLIVRTLKGDYSEDLAIDGSNYNSKMNFNKVGGCELD
jgi:hypothetical protein